MEIIKTYLVNIWVSNGPSGSWQKIKIILLENGELYRVKQNHGNEFYEFVDRKKFENWQKNWNEK